MSKVTPEQILKDYQDSKLDSDANINFLVEDSDGSLKLIFDNEKPSACYYVLTPCWHNGKKGVSKLCCSQSIEMSEGFEIDWGKERDTWDKRLAINEVFIENKFK